MFSKDMQWLWILFGYIFFDFLSKKKSKNRKLKMNLIGIIILCSNSLDLIVKIFVESVKHFLVAKGRLLLTRYAFFFLFIKNQLANIQNSYTM